MLCVHCISLSVMPVDPMCMRCVVPLANQCWGQASWGRGLGEQVGGGMHVKGFRVLGVCAGETVRLWCILVALVMAIQ